MTDDEILIEAEKTGATLVAGWVFNAKDLRALCRAMYRAGAAAERAACVKVCEEEIARVKPIMSVVAENALKAIRARGEK